MKTEREPLKELVHISSVIPQALQTFRSEFDQPLIQVWDIWKAAVGDGIAENAIPAAFKGKLLLVHVNSPAWIHQLQFLKKDMIDKLNLAMGKALIEDIKFKIGPV